VSRILNGSQESKRVAEAAPGIDEPTAPSASERNDDNEYAVYWQARSGLFTPVPDTVRHRSHANSLSATQVPASVGAQAPAASHEVSRPPDASAGPRGTRSLYHGITSHIDG
jgi:hypothetical protein